LDIPIIPLIFAFEKQRKNVFPSYLDNIAIYSFSPVSFLIAKEKKLLSNNSLANNSLELSSNNTLELSSNNTLELSSNNTLELSSNNSLELSSNNSFANNNFELLPNDTLKLFFEMEKNIQFCCLCEDPIYLDL
jgi:hypothetical protein